ncbi:MAG TPA: CoA pyrophosphatase [Bacteroidota bacterium]|nr:CoA pyrophosphatase [Bacteroidota bacterium]
MIGKEDIRAILASRERRVVPLEEYPGFRRAGVLILLSPFGNEFSAVFTVRTNEVETHKGQISFPGGMCDAKDNNDIVATALRETEEELGIPRTSIEVLGSSDDHATPSQFIVTPVVGYIEKLPPLKVNKAEVAEVFSAPLSLFAERTGARSEDRSVRYGSRSREVKVWFFDYNGKSIWGATAAMIVNLVDVLSGKM